MGYQVFMSMIQGATLTLALMAWWSCACRISAMHYTTHRADALMWHWAAAGLALALAGMAVWKPGDMVAFSAAAWLWWAMFKTMHEWADGSPAWTRKGSTAMEGARAC